MSSNNIVTRTYNKYDDMGTSFYEHCRNNERKKIRNIQKMIEKYGEKLNQAVDEYINIRKQIDILEKKQIDTLEKKEIDKLQYIKERDVIMFNYMLNHYKDLIMCELYEE